MRWATFKKTIYLFLSFYLTFCGTDSMLYRFVLFVARPRFEPTIDQSWGEYTDRYATTIADPVTKIHLYPFHFSSPLPFRETAVTRSPTLRCRRRRRRAARSQPLEYSASRRRCRKRRCFRSSHAICGPSSTSDCSSCSRRRYPCSWSTSLWIRVSRSVFLCDNFHVRRAVRDLRRLPSVPSVRLLVARPVSFWKAENAREKLLNIFLVTWLVYLTFLVFYCHLHSAFI